MVQNSNLFKYLFNSSSKKVSCNFLELIKDDGVTNLIRESMVTLLKLYELKQLQY